MVANLGHLSVSNSFNLVQTGEDPSGSDAVVVDNMVVELKSVQLLRFEFHLQVLQPLQSRLTSPLVVAMEAKKYFFLLKILCICYYIYISIYLYIYIC